MPFFVVALCICVGAMNTAINIKDTRNAELDEFENNKNYNHSLHGSMISQSMRGS